MQTHKTANMTSARRQPIRHMRRYLQVTAPAHMAHRMRARDSAEEGSGTVLALGIVAAILIMATVLVGFIGVSVANRRAAQAADLSALAAADALRGITPGDPCDIAEQIARSNDAHLAACSLADRPETVDIRVSMPVQGPFAFFGQAQGTARAGAPHPEGGEEPAGDTPEDTPDSHDSSDTPGRLPPNPANPREKDEQ